MVVILTLLILGVFSVLERTLMAAVQGRQGPITIMGNGILQFAADGGKLYSRSHTDILAPSGSIAVLALNLAIPVGLFIPLSGLSSLSFLPSENNLMITVLVLGVSLLTMVGLLSGGPSR